MPPPGQDEYFEIKDSQKFLNKNFYRFLFNFIAVIAGVLLFILVLGAVNG